MFAKFIAAYDRLVLRNPLATLIAMSAVIVYFLLFIPEFELDASADSLVLENDTALKYYRSIRERYGSDDFLIVTYSPKDELFSADVRADIASLRGELQALEQVDSVITMLDVPLVDSPPMTLVEMSRRTRTLESDDVDVQLAEKEMRSSPLYENLLVNSQGDTTAMQVNLVVNRKLVDLINSRDKLYAKIDTIPDGKQRLKDLSAQIKVENLAQKQRIEKTILDVRNIMDGYRDGYPAVLVDRIVQRDPNLGRNPVADVRLEGELVARAGTTATTRSRSAMTTSPRRRRRSPRSGTRSSPTRHRSASCASCAITKRRASCSHSCSSHGSLSSELRCR